ncbi:D-ala-D-ala transporter subunit; ATP-binding component of ABC superfamily (fragment) [Microbacterium sp. C448]|uniref:ABC transporter ATP-binding protein n=1 Tax=Microbacterium sp. C448 TaxID=1177594 RepID=UPI0003DE256F
MSLTTTQRQAERDTRVADAEPILRVQNLKVHLPTGDRTEVEAVSNVSITVHDGERVGIVGESGSGKSVTGRAISGLLPGSPRVRAAGSIRFAGREMNGASAEAWAEVRSRRIGMIFQDPLTFLNPTMKVGAQVAESLDPKAKRIRGERSAEVVRFLALAGLDKPEQVALQFPHELSGGMRQRVLIAIAIAKLPDLIIADEPTTALDATVQARVLKTLDETVSQLGNSLILISHDLAVVGSMTDRIYVMYNGHVVEEGATSDVLMRPKHKYTQALLRSVRSLSDDTVDLYSIPWELRRELAEEVAARAS